MQLLFCYIFNQNAYDLFNETKNMIMLLWYTIDREIFLDKGILDEYKVKIYEFMSF